MSDYTPPLRDMRFVLEHIAELNELAKLDGFESADLDTVTSLMDEAAKFVGDVIVPTNQVGDEQGCTFDAGRVTTPDGFRQAYSQYVEAGWGAMPFDPEYGGGGMPWVVAIALQEIITSANMAFSLCPMLTQGAIEMLTMHGSDELKSTYLPKMITGEWTGTMNLTEPQAGSDLGAVRAKAVPADDGTWRITGTKIFITWGDHDMADNIVHLVLARTPNAPPGTKGISCFIVPKFSVGDDGSLGERNDVECVSIEHKMGIHASPTCVMSFGDRGGALGYLIGEENQGMRYMFTMMNNARLSVGLQGLSISERAYQPALTYAQERKQGRAIGAPPGQASPIIDHPDVRRMLLLQKCQIEAMRALIYLNAVSIDLARHHPDPQVREHRQGLVELLTPVSKAWSTDLGVELTSLAVQVHGGMGYVEEAGASQHFRDSRIAPIYEGTNGIQALDLVGRKVPMKGGQVVLSFLQEMAALDTRLEEAGEDFADIRSGLARGVSRLELATRWILEHGSSNPKGVAAGATPYLRMFGVVTGAYLLALSALAASRRLEERGEADGEGQPSDEASRLWAKVVSARFYVEQVLPQAEGLVGPSTRGAETLFEIEPAFLGN